MFVFGVGIFIGLYFGSKIGRWNAVRGMARQVKDALKGKGRR
jgi:hypothetical protein